MTSARPPASAAASTGRAGLGLAVIVAGTLPPFLTASLAVRMRRDFDLGDLELALAIAGAYATATVSSAYAGRLVDRIGAARGVWLACAATGGCSLLIAAAVRSQVGLLAVLVLSGVANAMTTPAASALVTERVAAARHGVSLGVQQAGAPVGALLAGLAVPAVAVPLGWRWAFVIAAGLAATIAMATPRGPRRAPPRRSRLGVDPSVRRTLRLFAVAAALANVATVGLVSFLVVYAVESGLSVVAAGWLLSGTSLAAVTARVLSGAVADRSRRDPVAAMAVLLCCGAVGFAVLSTGHPAGVVVGALMAGGFAWGWLALMAVAIVRLSPEQPAGAVGMAMSGIYAGAGAGPLLVAVTASAASYTVAWLTAGALVAAAAAVVVSLRRAAVTAVTDR